MATIAPRAPPDALLSNFTLGGRIPLEQFYVDEAAHAEYRWGQAELEELVQHARRLDLRRRIPDVGVHISRVLAREVSELNGKASVVVYGSTEPWVECAALAAGAADVTTVEYGARVYDHPQLRTMHVTEHAMAAAAAFDVAVAAAAFDHGDASPSATRIESSQKS